MNGRMPYVANELEITSEEKNDYTTEIQGIHLYRGASRRL
jgi:hypothetical protein